MYKKKELNLCDLALSCVALEGFEPSQAEPESDVLPLHHKAVWLGVVSLLRVQSYDHFFTLPNFFQTFFHISAIFRFWQAVYTY